MGARNGHLGRRKKDRGGSFCSEKVVEVAAVGDSVLGEWD